MKGLKEKYMTKVFSEIGEFRKHYFMKIFLHFCIISPCSNDIKNKTSEKRSIILKCKYRWYTNVTKQQMEKPKRQNGKVKPITSWKACLNT